MTTAALHTVSAASESHASRWRPSIEAEQLRASWNRADRLFSAMRDRDVDAAVGAYADGACIIHPIIGTLSMAEFKVALHAFAKNSGPWQLRHEVKLVGPRSAQVAWWIDHVLFVTGRRIRINGITHLAFESGLIVFHRDEMAERDWSRQALGLKGLILSWLPGWRGFVEREMRISLGLEER